MAKYNKTNWGGGLNQFVDPSKVDSDSEYFLLVNGRTRDNSVSPIRTPLDITPGLPVLGLIQGAFPIGPYQVVFVNGNAYYRNFDPVDGVWTLIDDLQLSPNARRIYMATVPRSYMNYSRIAKSATDAKEGVLLGPPGTASTRCAIVMDGESQPWIIFPDATARRVKTFNEWSVNDREYVPAGCILPLYFGGILYCVHTDEFGVHNLIYRSVTGRPLDFMVAVDAVTGDKITTDEFISGANATSYQVDYGEITSVAPSQSVNEAFVVCTTANSYLVIPDYVAENMVYNEPVFRKQFLFPIGALNDQCITDVLADTAIIHFSGIRSFNAILNLRFEGKNAPFSKDIDKLISGIVQTNAACISFDNYAVFCVQTRYGAAILWYDTLTQKYAAIDQFEGIGLVKQFSIILTRTERKLFFVTVDNRIFEYFAGPDIATTKIYIKDFTPVGGNAEHGIDELTLQFSPVLTAGYIQASIITDGRLAATKAQQLPLSPIVSGDYIPIPYKLSSDGSAVNIPVKFGFKEISVQGNRTGYLLEWNADTNLRECVMTTTEATAPMPEQCKAAIPARITPTTVFFIGDDGDLAAGRAQLNQKIKSLNPDYVVGLGNHAFENGTESEVTARLSAYWENMRSRSRFYAVPGANDLNTDVGEPFYSAMRQPPTRYFKLETAWADIFMVNSGFNTAGTQVEQDNLNEATILASTQMQWLRTQLLASTKHKIVVWHHPPYSSANAVYPGVDALRGIPLDSWGATCHIAGHAHIYERIRQQNLDWFVCGVGTTDRFDEASLVTAGSQAIRTQIAGYLRFIIWPTMIEAAFVDINGILYDSFIINKS
jgi:hypothetical protein